MRRVGAIALALCALAGGACKGEKGPAVSVPSTASLAGPLLPALITTGQLQAVPGFSTARVQPIAQISLFEDKDLRGPCGAKVPPLPLTDAVGLAWTAQQIRGGSQFVIRLGVGKAKEYLDARRADARADCPTYTSKNTQGLDQENRLDAIVVLPRGNEQAFAVVNAIKIGEIVRAQTIIEVRRGDVLSRVVLLSETPLANQTIRGIGALMGKALLRLT